MAGPLLTGPERRASSPTPCWACGEGGRRPGSGEAAEASLILGNSLDQSSRRQSWAPA